MCALNKYYLEIGKYLAFNHVDFVVSSKIVIRQVLYNVYERASIMRNLLHYNRNKRKHIAFQDFRNNSTN